MRAELLAVDGGRADPNKGRVLDTELFLRHATVIFAESSMRNVDNWTFCYA
eukprot:COSAG05_NODE_2175_length_3437_cov_25.916417_7_plen_50_part_01